MTSNIWTNWLIDLIGEFVSSFFTRFPEPKNIKDPFMMAILYCSIEAWWGKVDFFQQGDSIRRKFNKETNCLFCKEFSLSFRSILSFCFVKFMILLSLVYCGTKMKFTKFPAKWFSCFFFRWSNSFVCVDSIHRERAIFEAFIISFSWHPSIAELQMCWAKA